MCLAFAPVVATHRRRVDGVGGVLDAMECKQLGRAYILQERGIYEGLRVDADVVAQMGCTSYCSFRRARAPKSDMKDLRYAIEVKRLKRSILPKQGFGRCL